MLTRVGRRVLFNVPASSQKMLDKAKATACDAVVLDLEDGVAPSAKGDARAAVASLLAAEETEFAADAVFVRINAWTTDEGKADLDALGSIPDSAPLTGLVLPKVEGSGDVVGPHAALGRKGMETYASIESAAGLLRAADIVDSALPVLEREDGLLAGLFFAAEDYMADIGGVRTSGGDELLYARSHILTVAKAFNLEAIDMVCVDFRDPDVLQAECASGVALGYTGKYAIHPAQVPIIQSAFSPSPSQIDLATRIMEAQAKAHAEGVGAFEVDNKVVDLPVIKWAQNILHRAQ